MIDASSKEDPSQLVVLVNPELVEAAGEVEGMEERLYRLETRLAGKPATTVLSVLWWEPLMVAGRRSLQNEILQRSLRGSLKDDNQ